MLSLPNWKVCRPNIQLSALIAFEPHNTLENLIYFNEIIPLCFSGWRKIIFFEKNNILIAGVMYALSHSLHDFFSPWTFCLLHTMVGFEVWKCCHFNNKANSHKSRALSTINVFSNYTLKLYCLTVLKLFCLTVLSNCALKLYSLTAPSNCTLKLYYQTVLSNYS